MIDCVRDEAVARWRIHKIDAMCPTVKKREVTQRELPVSREPSERARTQS